MTDRRARIPPERLPEGSAEGGHLRLPDRVAHHVSNVLRMEPGDPLELFDGEGRLLECRIQRIDGDDVRVAVLEDRRSRRNESPTDIVLCAAIPKGDRWRWLLEKATELGVARIEPLETRHTVVEISEKKLDRKLERWERIVGEASRQSERTLTPAITGPETVAARLSTGSFDGVDLLLHARTEAEPLAQVVEREHELAPDASLRIWIGPEGGFTDAEADQLSDSGAHFCHLGPRILRAETAAVAAVAVAQSRTGGLDRTSPE